MSFLLAAMALMLVLEGILPFLAPQLWRRTFEQAVRLTDGQLRFIGLCSVVIGLLALYLVMD